jgi:hypothetical protein
VAEATIPDIWIEPRGRSRRSTLPCGRPRDLRNLCVPGCGAVLHDLTSDTCPYCGAAFAQVSAGLRERLWRTRDEGATWTIVERTCPACGGPVTDPAATQCPKCGHQPLPLLDATQDPRPTVSIRIDFSSDAGRLWQNLAAQEFPRAVPRVSPLAGTASGAEGDRDAPASVARQLSGLQRHGFQPCSQRAAIVGSRMRQMRCDPGCTGRR